MADIEGMIAKLGNPSWMGRLSASWDLVKAAADAGTHDAVLSALAKALESPKATVRRAAASVLYGAASRADISAAIPALAKMLVDNDARAVNNSARALDNAIEKCASIERLGDLEKKLRECHEAVKKECPSGPEGGLSRIEIGFSKLFNKIARKRDSLATQRDIILDGKPKPPKGGPMFQTTRRALTNG